MENLEELTKPIIEANPMAGQMMSGMFNKEMIAQSYNQASLKALPGKPVKPGDSWPYSVTMNLPQMGSIVLTGKYTFKGMAQHGGASCAELTEDGTVSMKISLPPGAAAAAGANAGAAPAAPAPQVPAMGGGGTLQGTVWFDPALGMARESQFKQTMTIRMANPTKPDATMEIPTTQVITVTLASVEDAK